MVEGKANKDKGGNKKMMRSFTRARRYYHFRLLKFLSLYIGEMTGMNAQEGTE